MPLTAPAGRGGGAGGVGGGGNFGFSKRRGTLRDVDVPESLVAALREYVASRKSGKLLIASRKGNPLLQRNINRDWLHRVLEKVGLREAEAGRKRMADVGSSAFKARVPQAMRRFRCTHLETERIPESLIKIWLTIFGAREYEGEELLRSLKNQDQW